MRKILSCLIGISLLVSCGTEEKKEDAEGGKNDPVKPEVVGPVAYGGTFMTSENEKYQTLFPHFITDLGSANVANQMYEGLVKFNPQNLTVVSAIAESWTVDESLTEYTFSLKKDVAFHDDPCFEGGKGRTVTANDFKFAFELLCTKKDNNSSFQNTFQDRLEGANAYHNGEADNVSGITVVDDYTLKMKLTAPSASFIQILCNPILSVFPKEAYDKYSTEMKIGTGPFVFHNGGDPEKEAILLRNKNYHVKDEYGNQLPYVDTVMFKFIPTKTAELEAFRSGELSMIYGLPSEKITEVVQENTPDFTGKPPKYILLRQPEMVSQFYEFNLTREHFKDVRVRQAFSYAINKEKIVDEVLNGQASMSGKYGLTPPNSRFSKYDTSRIKGYSFNPMKAKILMSEAGYPEGKGFPSIKLELNSGGTRNSRVATAIADQLRDVLNVNVEIEIVPFGKKLEDAMYARADIFRSAWVADYPSPENFLVLMYGKNVPETTDEPSYPNTTRYKNPKFDELFEKGASAKTEEERFEYFAEAEKIMMEDAPKIILWYSENYKLFHSFVNGYYDNPMNYMDLTGIYIKAPTAPTTAKVE
jgi:oligopeptide transport system substrate-binding protein